MTPKYSALVIDDQENWRELLVEILEDKFEVKSADSYEAALEMIQNQQPPFHVLVTDMRLRDDKTGNEDGLKLIEFLNKRGDETKTIVVTGYATVDTAKRALSRLDAHDYLEKRPFDGSEFDYQAFQHIVLQAAQDADKKRPEGFSDISHDILVIDPDPDRRHTIQDILRKDGYPVTALQTSENLQAQLRETTQDYSLIIVDEDLSSSMLFSRLQFAYPKAQIILLTSKNIAGILDAMREYPVVTAFSLSGEVFNKEEFRVLVHSAVSPGAKKYISVLAGTKPSDQFGAGEINLSLGVPCKMNLVIQDAPTKDAVLVSLLPGKEKRGKICLHLFVYGENMKVEPSSERYWEIPLSNERPDRLEFTVIPLSPGKSVLTIEVDQNHRWLGRLSRTVNAMPSG